MSILFWTTSTAQYLKYKGTWITPDHEVLVIDDTYENANKISDSRDTDFSYHFSLREDTLVFRPSYIYQKKEVSDLYTFKVISISDTFLTITPVSGFAKKYFPNKKIIKFKKQDHVNDSINFEKIIFHKTSCFGTCPIIDVEIDNKKNIYFKGEFYKKDIEHFGELDSLNSGIFSGYLTDSIYNELLHLIQSCYLKTLNFKEIDCCDRPITTLIIYYDGKRKYLKSMVPPIIMKKLIDYLNLIYKKAILKPTQELKRLEE